MVALVALADLACVPSLNPFLNFRGNVFTYLARPVPVVLLRLDLDAHSTVRKNEIG